MRFSRRPSPISWLIIFRWASRIRRRSTRRLLVNELTSSGTLSNMKRIKHPSMKAAIGHAHRQERRHDGMLACQPCREYPEHGTLGAYTNWRCRCRPCQDGYMAARVEYWENRPREGYATKRYHANVQIIRSMKIGRTCAD